MDSSTLLFVILNMAAIVLVISELIFKRKPKLKLPPGPRPWPVIGNLHLIGSNTHRSLHCLSQKYGEIMLLRFGKFPVVVASSPEMAKQFLRTHDAVFASRHSLSAAGRYTSYNFSNMGWAPYGPYWRQARKIFLTEVLHAKRLKSFEHIRVEERRNFLSRLFSKSGKPVVLRNHLRRFTLTHMSRMVLSNEYFTESKHEKSVLSVDELQGMLNEWFVLNGVCNIGDWIPWLRFLDLQGYVKKMKALYRKFDGFHNFVIDDHEARRGGGGADFVPTDVVDVFLQVAEDPSAEAKLTRDNVKGLVQDLLAGGTDSTATAVEWAIHELLRHPHILEKAKEELDRVTGKTKWVEESDFSQLPYIDSIIMESMRLHQLTTLLVPRYAIEDCNVAGYNIAKGTIVLINAWSIGRDPNSWDAPEEFLPERFSGKGIDMINGSNFSLLPFGSGRRACPGYNLGLKVIRSLLANLLLGFELKLVEGMRPEDINMEEEYGLTTHPKEPITIVMEPRLPNHLY